MCYVWYSYNNNVTGIGPIKAYNLILDYGEIEKIEESTGKSPIGYKRAREMFSINVSDIPQLEAEYWDTKIRIG